MLRLYERWEGHCSWRIRNLQSAPLSPESVALKLKVGSGYSYRVCSLRVRSLVILGLQVPFGVAGSLTIPRGSMRPPRLLMPGRCVGVRRTYPTDSMIALPYHPRWCLSPQDAYEAGTLQDVYNGLIVGAEQLTSELVLVRRWVSRDDFSLLYGRVECTPSTGNPRPSISRVVLRCFRGFDRCSRLAGGCPEPSRRVRGSGAGVPRWRHFLSPPLVRGASAPFE